MASTRKLFGLAVLAVLLFLPGSLAAHGFRGRGWGGGWGFRGGYYRHSYYRPYYRHYSYGYSYPLYYYGYSYPRFGFYASFGSRYWPDYYWPYSYYSYPRYLYAPSYPVVIEREVVRYRERDRYEDRDGARYSRGPSEAEGYWLIALQDKSIQAVTDYWLDGSTLHYVSRQGTRSSVELSSVDIPLTKQLNRERGLQFRLPRSDNGYRSGGRDSFGRPIE